MLGQSGSMHRPHHPCSSLSLQAFRRECEEQPAAAVAEYLRAALARPDITAQLPRVRCRVLLLFGREALHAADCFEAASRLRKDHFAVHEVAQVRGAAPGEAGEAPVGRARRRGTGGQAPQPQPARNRAAPSGSPQPPSPRSCTSLPCRRAACASRSGPQTWWAS